MAWSMDKETKLRSLVAEGVPYGEALMALSGCETAEEIDEAVAQIRREAKSGRWI